MIVGFIIDNFNGHEKEAVEYIRKVCILDSPDIAQNIVNAGPGVNIFTNAVTLEELTEQPFSTRPIETIDGKYMVISAVNFNLELLINGRTFRLIPTEFTYIEPTDVSHFVQYARQGLIKVIPEIDFDGGEWLLEEGSWNDDGVWKDSDTWRDSNEQ